MSRDLRLSRESEWKAEGRPVTRSWRHVACRSIPFLDHARNLRLATEAVAPRRWFWRELLRRVARGPRGNLVLVTGSSGAGKSTLMAGLVAPEAVKRRPPGVPGRNHRRLFGGAGGVGVVGAHFCLGHAPETTSVELFVHNFAAALVSSPLTAAFKRDVAVPGAEELLRVCEQPDKVVALRGVLGLLGTIPRPGAARLVFVVDGLDECGGDSDELTIPRLLALAARDAPDWLAFVATARSEDGDAARALAAAPRSAVDLDGSRGVSDVRDYALARLGLPEAQLRDRDARLADRVASASKGSFQFAKAVLDLVAEDKASAARDLAELLGDEPDRPRDLDRLYETLFAKRFDPRGQEWADGARPALEVLLASPRALRVDELAAALEPFHPRLDFARALARLRPFLQLEDDGERAVLHASLRRWLRTAGPFRCDDGRGHAVMASHHLRRIHALTVRQHALLGFAASSAPALNVDRNQQVVFHVLEAAGHCERASAGDADAAAAALRDLAGDAALATADAQGRTAVHFAAKHATKKVAALRVLLAALEAADPPVAVAASRGGKTPLALAASRGRVDAVAALLQSTEAYAARGDAQRTAVADAARDAARHAAAAGAAPCVRVLLARGGFDDVGRDDLDAAVAAALADGLESGGRSALDVAVGRERVDAVAALLLGGARDVGDLDACLRAAAARGHEDLVQRLLAAGGDPGRGPARGGHRALNAAARNGHAGAARRLLRDARGLATLGLGDYWGRTPLHEAVYHLRCDVVRELLAAAPDALELLERADRDGATPVHVAAYWSKGRGAKPGASARANKILDLLLEVPLAGGASLDDARSRRLAKILDTRDVDGCCPLARAARADGDQLFMVARFLAAGAAVPGDAPAAAKARGNDRVAALLRDELALDGDPDLAFDGDDDDVWAAATRGDATAVRAKLARQPGLATVPDVLGRTPLHLAALCGNVECIRLLLAHGAADDDGACYSAAASPEAQFALRGRTAPRPDLPAARPYDRGGDDDDYLGGPLGDELEGLPLRNATTVRYR